MAVKKLSVCLPPALAKRMMLSSLAAKIALDYLTPFIVSNVGLLARQRH